jgi:hypothetical protein
MKTGDKVFYYEIEIDFMGNNVKQAKEEHKIVAVNSHYLCIDNNDFTSIKHTKWYSGDVDTLFNEVRTYEMKYTFTNKIFAELYTSSSNDKVAYRRMKKQIEKFIDKNYGCYLDFIGYLDRIIIGGAENGKEKVQEKPKVQ